MKYFFVRRSRLCENEWSLWNACKKWEGKSGECNRESNFWRSAFCGLELWAMWAIYIVASNRTHKYFEKRERVSLLRLFPLLLPHTCSRIHGHRRSNEWKEQKKRETMECREWRQANKKREQQTVFRIITVITNEGENGGGNKVN